MRYATGKHPYQAKASDLLMAKYLDKSALINSGQVPEAPSMYFLPQPDGALPMWDGDDLGNKTIGLCVFAGLAHLFMLAGKLSGQPCTITKDQVVALYAQLTGYDPVTGANDNGYNIRDLLAYAQTTGAWGRKVLAYTLVNAQDPVELAIATWLGCGTLGGFSLPLTAEGQTAPDGRQLWDVPQGGFTAANGPGTWGGHCIHCYSTSTDRDGGNSWGERSFWTRAWQQACQDEAWLILPDNWAPSTGLAPDGFALADLLADVAARNAASTTPP